MKIVVIGSINMDYSAKVNKLPQKGETIRANEFYTTAGGKGANQAVAAKRLGADVYMIGAVGDDSAGKELCRRLEAEGVKAHGIKTVDTPSGNAMITVDVTGNNTIVVFAGANSEMNEDWLMKNKSIIEEADYVIIQLEIPMETVKAAIRFSKSLDRKVILNPAPAAEMPEEVYKGLDLMTPNETELAEITRTTDIKEGAKQLLKKGVKSIVVTLGEKGSLYMDDTNEVYTNPYQVDAIDSTAAGDSFNAALAVGLSEDMSLEDALKFANAAGALTTTKLGAQASLPYRDEVNTFIKS
ncbi:MAG: ribokinase [Clostridia bacterium]|nr:ribokinase [Clostridia bacterium]